MTTLEVVRDVVGRRRRITREEMVDLLLALDLSPEASTITGRMHGSGALHVGGETLPADATRSEEQQAVARAWAKMCRGITTVSVMAYSDGQLGARYDEPGSMHPMQMAQLTFAPAGLDTEYLRRHARRVLVVTDA